MNRGSILHDDLTYTMLHEKVMEKFNLEANYPLNLSAKLSSIGDNFDITEDHENNESNHHNESHFGKPECSFTFRDYNEYEDGKNEFDDVVNDNTLPNYQKWQKYMLFKPDIPEIPLYKSKPMIQNIIKKKQALRSAPERHAAIALAVYNEFSLAYHVRWSRAHCPLVRYNYLTSNSVESVNACTVVYRKLSVLKLADTYRAMVQD
nr:transposase, MuDR, MULE transposase domain protein [Tanacetum cinerariifolium]